MQANHLSATGPFTDSLKYEVDQHSNGDTTSALTEITKRVFSNPVMRLENPPPNKLSLRFAQDGCRLPYVTSPKANLDQGRVFIANAGAANCNTGAYYQENLNSAKIAKAVRKDEGEFGLRSMLLAGPVDRYIAPVGNACPKDVMASLMLTKWTAEHARVPSPKNVELVPSLYQTLDNSSSALCRLDALDDSQIQVQVIEPNIINQLNSCDTNLGGVDRVNALSQMGLSHIAAYRKDAAEQLWRHRGLPTPETVYYSGQAVFTKAEIITQELKNRFSDFDALVVSGVGGCGGETVALVERNALNADILQKISDGDKLMIQPCLPLMMSPNVVANITDNGVEHRCSGIF